MIGSHSDPTYGYSTTAPSAPTPSTDPTWHQTELQDRLSQNQRVLHTQVFKEVITGHGANQARQLMVTEIDNTGRARNRRRNVPAMES